MDNKDINSSRSGMDMDNKQEDKIHSSVGYYKETGLIRVVELNDPTLHDAQNDLLDVLQFLGVLRLLDVLQLLGVLRLPDVLHLLGVPYLPGVLHHACLQQVAHHTWMTQLLAVDNLYDPSSLMY